MQVVDGGIKIMFSSRFLREIAQSGRRYNACTHGVVEQAEQPRRLQVYMRGSDPTYAEMAIVSSRAIAATAFFICAASSEELDALGMQIRGRTVYAACEPAIRVTSPR